MNRKHSIPDDFPEVRKIVEAGVTTKPQKDYELSRLPASEDIRKLERKVKSQEKKLASESGKLPSED